MGKGKGKKGKRGGKPGRGAAVAKRPEAAAAKPPAAPAPSPERPRTAPAPQPSSASATDTPASVTREPAGATTEWPPWLRAIGTRLGIYALFLLGAYCILVGLFSPWGFNIWDTSGRSGWGVFWLALGGGLLYAGWYLSAPDAPADGQGKSKAQQPRR